MKLENIGIRRMTLCTGIFFALFTTFIAFQESYAEGIERISVEEAFEEMKSGRAIVVCSYDDNPCKKILFEGAILRSEFESMVPSLSRNQEILFYCN